MCICIFCSYLGISGMLIWPQKLKKMNLEAWRIREKKMKAFGQQFCPQGWQYLTSLFANFLIKHGLNKQISVHLWLISNNTHWLFPWLFILIQCFLNYLFWKKNLTIKKELAVIIWKLKGEFSPKIENHSTRCFCHVLPAGPNLNFLSQGLCCSFINKFCILPYSWNH